MANDFEKAVNSVSAALASLDGDLEVQLQNVQKYLQEAERLESRIYAVREADRQCLEAGVDESDREFTIYSVDDLVFDFTVVKTALQKKAGFIENQIVARNMTNLTPQQLEDFETTFRHFDTDASNTLNLNEFKACLASLGNNYDVRPRIAYCMTSVRMLNYKVFLPM